MATNITRASERSVPKNRCSNRTCEIHASKWAVASFCLLAEADVCDCYANKYESEHDGESEEQLLYTST